jgi:hypothetical protein
MGPRMMRVQFENTRTGGPKQPGGSVDRDTLV